MRLNKALARVSQLKGQVFRLQNNQFHLLDVNDLVYSNDVILVDYQAIVLLTYFDKKGEFAKQLLPPDCVFVFQQENKPIGKHHLDRLTYRIEQFVPTANGESSSAHGVFLTTVNQQQYECQLIKPLSLAQIHAIEQLASLSVRCSQGVAYQFGEQAIIDLLVKSGYKPEKILSIEQPAKGSIAQREDTQFLYTPPAKQDSDDFFQCTYQTEEQGIDNATMRIRIETEQVELAIVSVSSINYVDYTKFNEQMHEVIEQVDSDEIEQEVVEHIESQQPMSTIIDDDADDLNFIEPLTEPVTYAVHSPIMNQFQQDVFVIDNFNPVDCLELHDLDEGIDDLSDYLRISLRYNHESLSSVVEVSYAGNIAANDVNQCVVINDVDLTNGIENQEDLITSLIDAGNLVVNFKQVA